MQIFGYLIAYLKARAAPQEPPTIINFFNPKSFLSFQYLQTRVIVLFFLIDSYGVLFPHPL